MSQAGYEKRDTNVTKLVIIGVASVVFVIVSIVFLNELFLAEKERLVQEVVLSVESEELKLLRQREVEELTSYQAIDSVPGRYRIPIERAMELIAAESKKPNSNDSGD